jgi:hypothetical protein
LILHKKCTKKEVSKDLKRIGRKIHGNPID